MKNTPKWYEQYTQMKEQYPDAILLFQSGDFFEAYNEDAKLVSDATEINTTQRLMRGQVIPKCEVAAGMVRYTISELMVCGYTVVMCEQVSNERVNGVADRAITDIHSLEHDAHFPARMSSLDHVPYHGKIYGLLPFVSVVSSRLVATYSGGMEDEMCGEFSTDRLSQIETGFHQFVQAVNKKIAIYTADYWNGQQHVHGFAVFVSVGNGEFIFHDMERVPMKSEFRGVWYETIEDVLAATKTFLQDDTKVKQLEARIDEATTKAHHYLGD